MWLSLMKMPIQKLVILLLMLKIVLVKESAAYSFRQLLAWQQLYLVCCNLPSTYKSTKYLNAGFLSEEMHLQFLESGATTAFKN